MGYGVFVFVLLVVSKRFRIWLMIPHRRQVRLPEMTQVVREEKIRMKSWRRPLHWSSMLLENQLFVLSQIRTVNLPECWNYETPFMLQIELCQELGWKHSSIRNDINIKTCRGSLMTTRRCSVNLNVIRKEVAISDTHKAPLLLASINPFQTMDPIAAANRTKVIIDLTWKIVSTTFIDEYNAKRYTNQIQNWYEKRKTKKKQIWNHSGSRHEGEPSSLDEYVDSRNKSRALAPEFQGHRFSGKGPNQGIKCDFCYRRGHI